MGGGTGEAGGAAGTGGHWTAGRGRGTAPAGVAWSTPAASGGEEEEEEERHRKFNNKRALSDLCALQCATCCHKVAAKAWEMNQERSQLLFSPFCFVEEDVLYAVFLSEQQILKKNLTTTTSYTRW